MKLLPTAALDQLLGRLWKLVACVVGFFLVVRWLEAFWLGCLLVSLGLALVVGLVIVVRRRRQGW
ncbi:MAG: hypothetical protein ACJ74U_19010 [Jatrophihabitantaceae bacterium]